MTRTGQLGRLFAHVSEPQLQVSPQDMQRLQLQEGDLVHLSNRYGAIVLPVQADPGLQPAQLYLPMHWGSMYLSGLGSKGQRLAGVNALTTPERCPRSKQPELKHVAVQLEKASLPWQCLGMAWLDDRQVLATRQALATLLGVPFGTWIGQHFGWRMAFAAVAGVGVVALGILAAFVPSKLQQAAPAALRDELSILASTPLWLGLGMTVFGFGGVFALYTYVEPLLSQITQMGNTGVAVSLLLFGAGSAVGNIAGGKLADRGVVRALWITLGALVAVLLAGRWAFGISAGVAMAYVTVLGVVAFATVAPMQMRVMQGVGSQGATLASSLNIAAFNLGNALGAWVGGSLIAGAGLLSIIWGAAALSAVGLVLVAMGQRRSPSAALQTA